MLFYFCMDKFDNSFRADKRGTTNSWTQNMKTELNFKWWFS